ncbi:hypothetical protein GQR58_027795 [Nymphon striatum]|nr:hypothetical protein GQR58_027795 [Nymphon striatum]
MEVSCKGEPCPPLHVTYPLHYSKKSRVGGLVLYFLKLVTSYQVLWEHTAASMKRTFISADSASQKINGKLYYGNFQVKPHGIQSREVCSRRPNFRFGKKNSWWPAAELDVALLIEKT